MTIGSRYQDLFRSFLQETSSHQLSITIFCKSLYVFLFLKVIFLWPVLAEVQRYLPYELRTPLHQILFAPIRLAQYDLSLFLIAILILLVLALVLRANYFTSAIIFWLSFSLSRLAFPIANGSDYVLNLFLFLSVFLPIAPTWKPSHLRIIQLNISNFVFLFCRVQLSLIYVLSGFDKLISEPWRSGDAVFSIVNLEYFINPHLTISLSQGWFIIIAWMIILFELFFPVLVWFKGFRAYALVLGIIFHLGIIVVLSLPDFGILMILTYSLFIPFEKLLGQSKTVTFGDSSPAQGGIPGALSGE